MQMQMQMLSLCVYVFVFVCMSVAIIPYIRMRIICGLHLGFYFMNWRVESCCLRLVWPVAVVVVVGGWVPKIREKKTGWKHR